MEALNGSFGTAYYTYTCITVSKSSLQTLAFFTLIYHYSLKMFSISPKYYLLCKRRSDIVFLMEHPVYSNITMYRALILVFFIRICQFIPPKSMCKRHFFLKFYVLRERSSDTDSFVEFPVYSNFKLYSVLILVLVFWFATIHPTWMCKGKFFLKF